ncbi:MAG: HD domain-containing protein [Candidatus Pacearchaeota archaeon]|jgi:HD-GYP domain-containing protein (c-di-GMP phosphodiesterase class II)
MTDQKLLNVFNPAMENKIVSKYLGLLKKYHRETYEHSLRVGLLCVYFGLENNLSNKKIKLLCLAGLLHDVGKLNISKKILSKTTKLNSCELEKIHEHPRRAFLILGREKLFEVRKIIVMHHEFCSCSYPRGGADRRKTKRFERRQENGYGELAQMLCVADEYDALSHKRSYHKALGCREIEKILKEQFKGKKKYINQVMKKCLIDFKK